ncbi:hypothetical protein [Sporisorium scitamineum]|uniref:GST C-terminal domain-containing protein n=1 Tax=Sporisorium scitamineum TaxID=49012 RepID=A0A0F7RZG7_9BASI|nr:hypothetical protein [Sporisorium scitamineum]
MSTDTTFSPSNPERVLYYLENSRAFRVAWLLEELSLPYTLKHYRPIVKYLIERYGTQRGRLDLLGTSDDWQERADVESWISFSEGMMVHTLAAVYPRWFADAETAQAIEAKMAANVHNLLNLLEQALQKGEFLVAGRLTAADIMCAFSVEYTFGMDVAITGVGKSMQDWPKVVEWLKRCARLPSYQRVLQRGATHRFTIAD